MKKLLILMLVMGLTSVASAALSYQISVHEGGAADPLNPVDSEITICVSDYLVLDIWTDSGIDPFGGKPVMLVCETTCGTISGGVAVDDSVTVGGPTDGDPDVIPPEGQEGMWFIVLNADFDPVPAGTVLANEIDFHCLAFGDCVISLYEVIEGAGVGVLYDQVIIHQVPEPASMLLLGLGGLLLRRRK